MINIKNKSNRFSTLIQSCDNYEWFWSGIFCTLDLYWDFKYPVYFATEEKDIHNISYHFNSSYKPNSKIKLINHEKSSDASGFSTRMIDAIKKIDSEYILYLQEDMWLRRPLEKNLIEDILNFMDQNSADSVKIHSRLFYYDSYILEPTDFIIQDVRMLKMSEVENNCFLSHNATIWRKDYLLKHQVEGETPWINEIEGSKRMFSDSKNHYIYNIHWYCQPGAADKGELSGEGNTYAHILWEMTNLNLKFNLLQKNKIKTMNT